MDGTKVFLLLQKRKENVSVYKQELHQVEGPDACKKTSRSEVSFHREPDFVNAMSDVVFGRNAWPSPWVQR